LDGKQMLQAARVTNSIDKHVRPRERALKLTHGQRRAYPRSCSYVFEPAAGDQNSIRPRPETLLDWGDHPQKYLWLCLMFFVYVSSALHLARLRLWIVACTLKNVFS
jgi:hypothetical protein